MRYSTAIRRRQSIIVMVEKTATQPLRVVITTGDEPIVVNHFVEEVIARNPQRIVGMAVVGSISSMPDVTRKGKKNKNTDGLQRFLRFPVRLWGLAKNILVVVLIFGVAETTRQILRMIRFRASLMLNRLSRSFSSQSIFAIGKRRNIHTWRATHVNEPMLAKRIAELKPDIIINQAPGILREEFLNLARLGVLIDTIHCYLKIEGGFQPSGRFIKAIRKLVSRFILWRKNWIPDL